MLKFPCDSKYDLKVSVQTLNVKGIISIVYVTVYIDIIVDTQIILVSILTLLV